MGDTTYLELDRVAKQLGCNRATLYKAVNTGELKAIAGVWRGKRTTQQWVQEWIDKKTTGKAGGTK